MRRKKTDKEMLQEVEGIGPKRSENLLSRFGSGREVYKRSTMNWGSVAKTEGISEDTAQEMFDRMDEAGVRDELKSRGRSGGEVRGVARPTDIGREADGEYARPESAPDIAPAPVARNTRNGEFGLDPFDLTSGGVGESVELFDANRERPRETDRREREEEMGIVPEQAFMQSDSSVADELNDLYDNGDSDDDGSVPTRPYESRNDGPPSQLGPYELTQDRQNDGFRTVAFQNTESDRSVVFQTYNTDLDGPEATVDVSYGENTETIAEGDADSVYQQFIGELEERRDRNRERDPSDGSGIQNRADERLEAAQRLFGGNR